MRNLPSLLISILLLCSCGSTNTNTRPDASQQASTSQPGSSTVELVVFAAASLQDAFAEIAAAFMTGNPDVKVLFSFAGSNQLRVQIEQGAHVDVFASANVKEMDALVQSGWVVTDTAVIFAHNKLAIIVPKSNPAGIQSPRDLAKPRLKLVLADAKVPAGLYARQMLDKFSQDPEYGATFSVTVMANVVSNEENVRSVVEKVQLGEADAGIVYISDVTPQVADRIAIIPIPDRFNVTATYTIAPLKDAPHAGLAAQLIAAILSREGQTTLAKWGYEPVR